MVGVVAVLGLGLGLVGCGSSGGDEAAADGSTTTTVASAAGTPESEGDLFVLTASGGSLGDDTLELTGVDAQVTAFADRPDRTEATEDLEAVVDGWSKLGFADDPPNAALVTRSASGLTTTVYELGTPEASGATLTFPVTPVDAGDVKGALAGLVSGEQPEELDEPTLFIDAGSDETIVSVTIQGTWGSGDTRVSLDGWYFSRAGGTSMAFQMEEAGTIRFTAGTGFLSLRSADPEAGTFAGIGVMDDPSTLEGQASVAPGSDLTISVCGSTQPLSQEFVFEPSLPC